MRLLVTWCNKRVSPPRHQHDSSIQNQRALNIRIHFRRAASRLLGKHERVKSRTCIWCFAATVTGQSDAPHLIVVWRVPPRMGADTVMRVRFECDMRRIPKVVKQVCFHWISFAVCFMTASPLYTPCVSAELLGYDMIGSSLAMLHELQVYALFHYQLPNYCPTLLLLLHAYHF